MLVLGFSLLTSVGYVSYSFGRCFSCRNQGLPCSHHGGVEWEKPSAGRIQLVSAITVLIYRVEKCEIFTCCTDKVGKQCLPRFTED